MFFNLHLCGSLKNNILKFGLQTLKLDVACTSKRWCRSHSKNWPWSVVQCLSKIPELVSLQNG